MQVYWGRQKANWEGSVQATSRTFDAGSLCGPPAGTLGFVAPGQQNTALVTGLVPDTVYYYKVGDVSTYFSDIFTFRSPPAVQPSSAAKVSRSRVWD